jgi:predicted  nucleic acid-binding Zn-ribbon protein/mRNA-degrading endonuclease YafQ of YafQ-DinJ toxin-antitoxin module
MRPSFLNEMMGNSLFSRNKGVADDASVADLEEEKKVAEDDLPNDEVQDPDLLLSSEAEDVLNEKFTPELIEQFRANFLRQISEVKLEEVSKEDAALYAKIFQILNSSESSASKALSILRFSGSITKESDDTIANPAVGSFRQKTKEDHQTKAKNITSLGRTQQIFELISDIELMLNDLMSDDLSENDRKTIISLLKEFCASSSPKTVALPWIAGVKKGTEIQYFQYGIPLDGFGNVKNQEKPYGIFNPQFISDLGLRMEKLSNLKASFEAEKNVSIKKLAEIIRQKQTLVDDLKDGGKRADFFAKLEAAMAEKLKTNPKSEEIKKDLKEVIDSCSSLKWVGEDADISVSSSTESISRILISVFSDGSDLKTCLEEISQNQTAIVQLFDIDKSFVEEIAIDLEPKAENPSSIAFRDNLNVKFSEVKEEIKAFKLKVLEHRYFADAIEGKPSFEVARDLVSQKKDLISDFGTVFEVIQQGLEEKKKKPLHTVSAKKIPSDEEFKKAKIAYEKILLLLGDQKEKRDITATIPKEMNEMTRVEIYSLYQDFFEQVKDYFGNTSNYHNIFQKTFRTIVKSKAAEVDHAAEVISNLKETFPTLANLPTQAQTKLSQTEKDFKESIKILKAKGLIPADFPDLPAPFKFHSEENLTELNKRYSEFFGGLKYHLAKNPINFSDSEEDQKSKKSIDRFIKDLSPTNYDNAQNFVGLLIGGAVQNQVVSLEDYAKQITQFYDELKQKDLFQRQSLRNKPAITNIQTRVTEVGVYLDQKTKEKNAEEKTKKQSEEQKIKDLGQALGTANIAFQQEVLEFKVKIDDARSALQEYLTAAEGSDEMTLALQLKVKSETNLEGSQAVLKKALGLLNNIKSALVKKAKLQKTRSDLSEIDTELALYKSEVQAILDENPEVFAAISPSGVGLGGNVDNEEVSRLRTALSTSESARASLEDKLRDSNESNAAMKQSLEQETDKNSVLNSRVSELEAELEDLRNAKIQSDQKLLQSESAREHLTIKLAEEAKKSSGSAAEIESYKKKFQDLGFVLVNEQSARNLQDRKPLREALSAITDENTDPNLIVKIGDTLLVNPDGYKYSMVQKYKSNKENHQPGTSPRVTPTEKTVLHILSLTNIGGRQ